MIVDPNIIIITFLFFTQKIAFLICTLFVSFRAQREWPIYDKFNIFSISPKEQVMYFIISLVCATPDGLIAFFEMANLFKFLEKEQFQAISLVHAVAYWQRPWLMQIILFYPIILTVLSYIIRYRALLTMIYVSVCVRQHLRRITNQLISSHGRVDKRLMRLARRVNGHLLVVDDHDDDGDSDGNERCKSNQIIGFNRDLNDAIINGSISSAASTESIVERKSSLSDFDELSIDQSGAQRKSSYLTKNTIIRSQATKHEKIRSPIVYKTNHHHNTRLSVNGNQDQRDQHTLPLVRSNRIKISNVHQLEAHLTMLAVFIHQLDHEMCVFVFYMCLLNMIQLIYTVLFAIKLEFNLSNIFIALAISLGRLILPIAVFFTGGLLERESKRLHRELEIIFVQDHSGLLVYKQFNVSVLSWDRVFKILAQMKFSCDRLIAINLTTMVKYLIYAASYIFFSVQFGKYYLSYSNIICIRMSQMFVVLNHSIRT